MSFFLLLPLIEIDKTPRQKGETISIQHFFSASFFFSSSAFEPFKSDQN